MLTEEYKWVAVMTHANAEQLAADTIAQFADEVYLPMMHVRDKRRRNMMPEKPMFPSYLFAHINKYQIFDTRTARGVIGIVSANHSAIVVPQRDIDMVRAFEATERKVFIHDTAKLVKGNEATITDGEFAGMHGRVVRGCKDGNFAVNIEVMNVSFVVHVRRDELRPA